MTSRGLIKYLAEREALEPALSQNITQSQISINNQLITIIIKSKYYRISLAISIFWVYIWVQNFKYTQS